MVVVIDDNGAAIDRQNGCFRIILGQEERVISPVRVTAFHIMGGCNLTSGAILLAAESSIPLLFFDRAAKVKARLWQANYGSTVRIRHGQLAHAATPDARQLAVQWLTLKAQGQMRVMRHLADRLPAQRLQLGQAMATNAEAHDGLITAQPGTDNAVFVAESQMAKAYWNALGRCMEGRLPFSKRSRRPAQDGFNALLNYAYGMFYSVVESAALTAGLDPHVGLLHREEYNRPALVFDAIEPFRPWADRLVCDVAMRKMADDTWFDTTEGVLLSKPGKRIFIPLVLDMLNERTQFNGRRIKRKDQVQHLLTTFAQDLLKTK